MLRSIFLLITKFIPTGSRIRILTGPLKGIKWIAGAAEGNGKGLSVLMNLSEPEQIKKAVAISSKNKTVFDIGANVGLYAVLYARYCKQVYCFEPLPRNLHYLYKILSINHFKNATIVPFAVGAHFQLANFQEHERVSEGKLSDTGSQPAVVIDLKTFIEKYKVMPDIIKIDVEGAEYDLLKSVKDFINSIRNLEIMLSVHTDELRRNCLGLLKECGFNLIEPLDTTDINKAFEYYFYKQETGS